MDEANRRELKRFGINAMTRRYDRCVFAGMVCDRGAVRAHSIQSAHVLQSMARDGHVVMPELKFRGDQPPEVTFTLVGRNRASTFTGLCAEHDSAIFRPIDLAINPDDREHRLLLAYRSVLREAHTTMRNGIAHQGTLNKAVDLGLIAAEQDSPAMRVATGYLLQAWLTYQLKVQFDMAYLERQGDSVEHVCSSLPGLSGVAASSVFSTGEPSRVTRGAAMSILNVFPLGGDTVVLLSFLRADRAPNRRRCRRLIKHRGDVLVRDVSRAIIANCENMAIAPELYDSYSDRQRELIQASFVETIFDGRSLPDDPYLNLFEVVV